MQNRWPQGTRPGPIAFSGVLVLLLASPAAAQTELKSRRDFPTGKHPVAAIAVDFDGDGFLDVVSVDQIDDALGLVKGFGDGTFRRVRGLTVGSLPTAVAFADTNGDGRPDLITTNLRSQEITVNLNEGEGAFAGKIGSPVPGFAPSGLAVGDWNHDGRLDAALVAASQNALVVLTRDGSGRFVPTVPYAVGSSPRQVLATDFNRDGHLDLAVVNNLSASIDLWRGNGAGQFALQTTLATGSLPQGLGASDLDGDSDVDLVICNHGSDTVGVYLNNGSGGFGSPALLSPGFGPRAAVVADINGDGKPDLLVTLSKVSGVGQVAILLGNGAGGFGAPSSFLNTGPVPNAAAPGDFNRDGQLDLVTVNLTGNTISFLQNTGGGAFLSSGKVPLPSGAFPQGVVVADLDRDGNPDLASANQGLDNVSLAYGSGSGGFSTLLVSPVRTGTAPSAIVAGDTNRDGNIDLCTANNGSDDLTYLQGGGSSFGTFNVPAGCTGPVALATGDVSGDLLQDLAVVCEGSSLLCVRQGTGSSGTGAFGGPVCTLLAGIPSGIVLGNFNGDPYDDAAVSFGLLNSVSIIPSDGAGGVIGSPVAFAVGLQPAGLAQGDIDRDGVPDLVVANSGSDSISTILRGAPGAPVLDSPTGLAPTAVALADFNGDGELDAAAVNTNDNNVSLLLGDGTGRFSSAGYFGTCDLPVALAAGDFNRDGKPDLAVADYFSDSLTILLNRSMTGDPLQWVSMLGGARSVFRWGLVPGAAYDIIRGGVRSIVPQGDHVDLGPVVCLANDIAETDTAAYPDAVNPAKNEAFFYLVRPIIGGVPGSYTVSTGGKVGVPSSGDCG